MSLALEPTLESLLFLSPEPVGADALAEATGAELHEVVTSLERLHDAGELVHGPPSCAGTVTVIASNGARCSQSASPAL